jgi:hypothetical protein
MVFKGITKSCFRTNATQKANVEFFALAKNMESKKSQAS